MNYKSQVSIFIMIGLIILSSLVFLYSVNESDIVDDTSEINFNSNMNIFNAVEYSVELCIESSIKSSINLVSYNNQSVLKNLVESEVLNCINSIPRDNFIDIQMTGLKYQLYNENLLFSLNYTIIDDEQISHDKNAYVNYPRQKIFTLFVDDSVNSVYELYSQNEGAYLTILDDSLNSNSNISITFVDPIVKNLSSLEILIGNYVYNFGPSGFVFNNPVELRIDLDLNDLENVVRKRCPNNDLCSDIYDELHVVNVENGVIIEYLETEIDISNNQAVAYTSHFSTYGVVKSGCQPCSSCYFKYKGAAAADKTWRVRLPTGTPRQSSITVGGTTFTYRSQDTDCGCSRPSYNGPSSPSAFSGSYTVISGGNEFTLSTGGWQSCSSSSGSTSGTTSGSSSGTTSGTCTYSGSKPSSPTNCDSWDYSADAPCPSGYVNCDGENNCGFQGSCSDCPTECP